MYGVCAVERGTIVFLRVRIITLGGDVTSSCDDPVERRLARHGDDRVDRRGVDVMALVEPVVEADQHVAGAGRGFGLALDLHLVAARRDMDAEPVLDRDQMAVEIAEQRAEQIGLLEFELEPGAAGDHWRRRRRGRGGPSGGYLAGGAAPARLLGHAVTESTSTMSPIAASVSTMHRLEPRRLADHLAGLAALAVDQDAACRVPTLARLKARLMLGDAGLEALQPFVHHVGGIWSSMAAAGVPGRREYLNE